MNHMLYRNLILAGSLLFATTSFAVPPLLTDHFNDTPNTLDINNNLIGRQGGTLATNAYAWQNFPSIVPSSIDSSFANSGYLNISSGSKVWLDHDFIDTLILNHGELRVSFDTMLAPTVSDAQWLHIGFGVLTPTANTVQAAQTDFGVLLRANGGAHSFTNAVALGEVTFDASPTIDEIYHVELRLKTTSFALNAPATAELWIGGTQIDLDNIAPGVNARSFTWDSEGANYVVFATSDAKYIDNLVFAIPEPSAFALLGIAALLLRKRRG